MSTPSKKPRPSTPAERGRLGGRLGGLARSPAKKKAARENGKLGGRPRKTPGAAALAHSFADMPPKLLQALVAMPEILAENVIDAREPRQRVYAVLVGLARYFLASRQVGVR